jgi:hypothetical protein
MKHIFIIALTIIITVPVYSQSMKKQYKLEVKYGLERTQAEPIEPLTEKDLQHLPEIVKKYLYYSHCIGKPKVNNFYVAFNGRIRSENTENTWMKFKAEQYSFIGEQTRLFYITAYKMGIPAGGLHCYKNGEATMKIKMLGLFTIVDAKGDTMNRSETVTLFNDMCCMAPAALISPAIRWKELTDTTVEANFTNDKYSISAILSFSKEGRLVDFISNDRFEIKGKTAKLFPWSTPISEYKEYNGYYLPSKANLNYQHPEGLFCYGQFEIIDIQYNVKL